jgi:glycerol uptake facilitator-like aquaporin
MSFEVTDRVPAATLARITGGTYLLFIVASVLANALGHIGLGDAQQIYGSITTRPETFRFGLVSAFVSTFLFLMAAWGLYALPRIVNKDLALLYGRIPGEGPVRKSLELGLVALILVTLLIEVPAKFFTPTSDALRYFLIGTALNGLRIFALAVTIGYLFGRVDGRVSG